MAAFKHKWFYKVDQTSNGQSEATWSLLKVSQKDAQITFFIVSFEQIHTSLGGLK